MGAYFCHHCQETHCHHSNPCVEVKGVMVGEECLVEYCEAIGMPDDEADRMFGDL